MLKHVQHYNDHRTATSKPRDISDVFLILSPFTILCVPFKHRGSPA